VATGDQARNTTTGFDAVVRGHVQGVGYRFFVLERARTLKLRGYVGNLPDGAVRVVAAGPRRSLELLLESLRKGPFMARVNDVAVTWGLPATPPGEFGIRM